MDKNAETQDMFCDKRGYHARTKKEIFDEDRNISDGCRIIKKSEIYERRIVTIKDERFKWKFFLDEVKSLPL